MTYRVEAEALGPDVFGRVVADLSAPVSVADVNEMSPDEKRALMKAERARRRQAAEARSVGG